MIFFESFENRIIIWHSFREKLETDNDPISSVIQFWNKAPISPRTCDPFDPSTWLKAWDLIEENQYCEFSKILAIYYTLSLTKRFEESYFEIQVVNDPLEHELKYLLVVDHLVIGYKYDTAILTLDLPKNIRIQASYCLPFDS